MSEHGVHLPRVEGGLALVRGDDDRLRVNAPRSREFEALLRGRSPLDAVYLTQHISADSGLTHGLTAVGALERAARIPLAGNGRVVRELLHGCSVMHSHLRHLYSRVLPDYLPFSAFADYDGERPGATRIARGLSGETVPAWAQASFDHPFEAAQVRHLAQSHHRAAETQVMLQQVLALLGGKYPMTMSLVPGGVTTRVTQPLILRLGELLSQMQDFLEETVRADAKMLVTAYEPLIAELGASGANFISSGSLGDPVGPDQALFPPGVVAQGKLESFQGRITESVRHAFYRIPEEPIRAGARVEPDPDKPGAYSWIKAPRYGGLPMETGPAARLSVAYLGGSRTQFAPSLERIESALGAPLPEAVTVSARLLALGEEVLLWSRRCRQMLEHLLPDEPGAPPGAGRLPDEGEGDFALEAPGGTVRHHVVLRNGRIAFYNIIAPGTWNASPQDDDGTPGPLESALNAAAPHLNDGPSRREAARLLHSYAISATDAVH